MQYNINGEKIDYNMINLKCIDDFNNKISLILENNINGIFKILNINYIVDIPKSKLFSEIEEKQNSENENENENENDNDIIQDNKYNKSMLFDPFD